MSIRYLLIKFGFCFSLLLILANLFSLNSCTNNGNKKVKDAETLEGEMLVQKYCTSCHVSVSPDLLDNETWQNHVLPEMGKKLGISKWSGQYFPVDLHSGISILDWHKIVTYYSKNSPKALSEKKFIEPLLGNTDFLIEKPLVLDSPIIASTTMVKFSPNKNVFYTADAKSNNLYKWGSNLKIESHKTFESPVVDITFYKDDSNKEDKYLITSIGIMNPVDNPQGKVVETGNKNLKEVLTLAEKLPRPVNSLRVDVNKDGLMDVIVCGFGHDKGGLFLLKQLKNKRYSKILISPRSGAIQSAVGDFNKDGWPDIMCLFAQQDEGVWMYLNDQHGGFKSVNILRFPPVYGSSSFQLIDFDKDGFEDILYTSGDNSDFSMILKPYHGIYIFSNDGKYKFKQTFFYPINGCTKATATDFNKDGRLDIATIAFFADYKKTPQESFIYFMQNKHNKFIAKTLPIQKLGKWLCMDVNDFDKDGFPDIILGNFSIGGFINQGIKPDWDVHLPFILLRNRFKKHAQ